MSIALESVYANDVESKVTTNNTESPYQCVDICSKDIPSETTAQKFRKSSSMTKLLALLGLITFLMFIALLVMPFALQSSWRQDANKLEENWEQVVNRITANLTRMKGDMDRRGERISANLTRMKGDMDRRGERISANLTRMKGDMDRRGERISKLQNKTEHSIRQLNESADNLLNQLKVGKSMRSLIETKVDTLNVSIRNILRTQSVIQAASGWHISGNFVYKYFSASVTYLTASSSCQNLGGRLAATILRDPNAIRDIIQKNYVGMQRASSNFWIGYDDRITEGTWQWADSGDTNSFVIWDSGQPDNSNNEDCAQVWNVRNGRLVMNDAPCTSNSNSYLCEFSSL